MRIELGRCLLDSCLNAAGMSRQDLIAKTGYSRQQISSYVRKHKRKGMLAETLFTIAYAIGCEEKELYERIVIPSSDDIQKKQTKKT